MSAPERSVGRDHQRSQPEPPPVHFLPVAVRALQVPPAPSLNDPSLYFNRELRWVDFNWRVLHQALDERTPLLERARFLAITQRNLDEFIAKRVGGLKSQLEAGVVHLSPDGLTPREQMQLLREAILLMQQRMTHTWERDLRGRIKRRQVFA